MTAPLSAESPKGNIVVSDERAKELREWLTTVEDEQGDLWGPFDALAHDDLLAILSSYSSMRAENESLLKRLREEFATSVNNAERFQKAEAKLEKQKGTIKLWQDRADELDKECREQFAQLAAFRADFSATTKALADALNVAGIPEPKEPVPVAEGIGLLKAQLAKQAPLPKEVEAAMDYVKEVLDNLYIYTRPSVFKKTEAALAVIRAALTATIKPPLTVAQTTKVTREWVSWFVKTLFDMKMRGVTFPVEGAAETMLQSVGIEVEP